DGDEIFSRAQEGCRIDGPSLEVAFVSASTRAVDEDVGDVIDHVEVENRSATGRRLPIESPTEPDGALPIESGFRINRPQVAGVARVALSFVGVGGIRMGTL